MINLRISAQNELPKFIIAEVDKSDLQQNLLPDVTIEKIG
jgi:hypothetical protein